MTIGDEIKDEKLQNDMKTEAAKISALSSGEINKCHYLTGKQILPSDQSRMIEQTRLTSSSLAKAFEEQMEKVEDEEGNHFEALKV